MICRIMQIEFAGIVGNTLMLYTKSMLHIFTIRYFITDRLGNPLNPKPLNTVCHIWYICLSKINWVALWV